MTRLADGEDDVLGHLRQEQDVGDVGLERVLEERRGLAGGDEDDRRLRVLADRRELVGREHRAGGPVEDDAEMPAGELSGGQRRLLALGRAMAMRPRLLMLDEPAAGLSPVNLDILLDTVLALKNRFGLTVIIIEHILKVVMETCETVSVLDHGEKIAEGSPAAIKEDHRVIEAYLGKEMDDAEVRAFLRSA